MKLTPFDIHQKEFRHSLRGYDEKEVDDFLDAVADELERLFKENIDQSEKLDAMREQVRQYEAQKDTLHNTLVAAQRSAEDIVAKAQNEATGIVRDADAKAKEIIHNALQKKQQVANELVRIKQAEEQFRSEFRSELEKHMAAVNEIKVGADVDQLLAETDSGFTSPAAEPEPVFSAPAAAPVQAPAAPVAQPTQVMPVAPVSAASAVVLGEVESPAMPDAPVTFVDPGEFSVPSFDVLGEREDDIEEID